MVNCNVRAVAALKWLGGQGLEKMSATAKVLKILGFECPKTAQMVLKFLCFFRNIFKYVQDFSCSSKQFLRTFYFLQGLFHKNSETFLFKMKTFRPFINFYISSFSASTNTVALIQLHRVLYI